MKIGGNLLRFAGLRLASGPGVWLVRSLSLTMRVKMVNLEAAAAGTAALEATIYAMWHDQLLTMLVSTRRLLKGLGTLSSEHPDSEIIVRLVRRIGLNPIRGSSTRGGLKAMLSLIRFLKAGGSMVFTPDGPKGPRHRAADGIIALSQLSGARIVPIACGMRPEWRVGSWDRLQVPVPFARSVVLGGEALRVPSDIDATVRAEYRSRLERALEELTSRAESIVDGAK